MIDLSPFGFTKTESTAYSALLARGPSGGYAVAKALSIARANAYQALNGLVAKGAAIRLDGQPQRFKAIRPQALLARLVERVGGQLDRLESQIAEDGAGDGNAVLPITGSRAFLDVATRTAARAVSPVTCVAPQQELQDLAPAWRKRAADGHQTDLWVIGSLPETFPLQLAGSVSDERATSCFGGSVALLSCAEGAVVVTLDGDAARGYWTSDPVLLGTLCGAVAHLTGADVSGR